jgi:hypothetical protein
MGTMPRFRMFATKLCAIDNCLKDHLDSQADLHLDWLEKQMVNAPSGSGIDTGTIFDWEKSTPNKLIFYFSFHHMNENGYYDGWTEHALTVKPSLMWQYDLHISGPNRNEIKDYLYEVYDDWLSEPISNYL